MSVKERMKDVAFHVYVPVIIRVEKMRATRMWRDGVRQCEKMYKELGAPRIYLFFDTKHRLWVPMTYESNKQFRNSLRMLRIMGKLRGMGSVNSVEKAKASSFYYTESRWGALSCADDNRIRAEKLKMWVSYYVDRLSEPMQKIREYKERRSIC